MQNDSVSTDALPFHVYIDNNFDIPDFNPKNRRYHDAFATAEKAVEVCKAIVNRLLTGLLISNRTRCKTAEEFYDCYTSFGADPWVCVESDIERPKFSAWDYAKVRCAEILEECKEELKEFDKELAAQTLIPGLQEMEDLISKVADGRKFFIGTGCSKKVLS